MPSVRVRRATYSSLADDPTPDAALFSLRSRTPTNVLTPFQGAEEQKPVPQTVRGIRTRTMSDPGDVLPNGRALCDSSSKISHHIWMSSPRRRYLSLHCKRASRDSNNAVTAPLKGPHINISARRSDIVQSHAGCTLRLPYSNQDDPAPYQAQRHEDNIVDHLAVIDPRISTVSALVNAANAILIPPLSFYSRRPLVTLPAVASYDPEHASVHDDDLDRHIEDILSKRQLFKRVVKGVWAFLKTPMGVVTAVYGFCVAFWGAAIVLFLAKIINLHNPDRQGFWVEVSSQVENGLFTVTGIGLIPWRVIDTYRIHKIWNYKRRTRKLRAKANLPKLYDEDDLPDPIYVENYVHVLNDEEQADLHYQQAKFMKSQTWYRPHGTETHRAFPINTALLICCLNDGNSLFQIILCGTMWGLNRFERPAWSTGLLIPASFLCGILSAICIWRGGEKTKRTTVVAQRLRMALAIETNNEGTDNMPVFVDGQQPPEEESEKSSTMLKGDRRPSPSST